MKVLITNDDGVDSPGLRALAEALSLEHETWIVAPDGERSGSSHSVTLRRAVRIREIDDRTYSCEGTPADCVLFALLGAIPSRPDVVISGINLGPNLGTDIIYSGTVAAARQASLMGCPSVAVSVDAMRPPFHLDGAAQFVARNLEIVVERWTDDHFLNVNFPNVEKPKYRIVMTHPSRRIYRDKAVSFVAPNRDVYYFLDGSQVDSEEEDGSDACVVSRGEVSVSPVFLHPVNHSTGASYDGSVFR